MNPATSSVTQRTWTDWEWREVARRLYTAAIELDFVAEMFCYPGGEKAVQKLEKLVHDLRDAADIALQRADVTRARLYPHEAADAPGGEQ